MDFGKYQISTDGQMDGQTNGRADRWTGSQMDRQTEMIKLTAAFHSFVNAPKQASKRSLSSSVTYKIKIRCFSIAVLMTIY
jgi:hypothetical protein